MEYFVPDIRVAAERPALSTIEDKFGGIPWGLAPELWPMCRSCGKSQTLLAQLIHDPPRLDLGRRGRVLFVFQCDHDPGMCDTWRAGSGANACFVVEPEELNTRATPLPADSPTIEHEVRVVGWQRRDDGIPAELSGDFFDEDRYEKLSESILERVPDGTKLGGVPCWIQGCEDSPSREEGWRFIGQLDSLHRFLEPPTAPAQWISPGRDRSQDWTHVGQGPNFGDRGIAYLFIRPGATVPECRFFWQCS